MKDRMFKYFTANNTRRYVDVLNDMVSNIITLSIQQSR
jgi:hypothetical protein